MCIRDSHHADTDAKKRDRFRRGLNTKLKECLNLVQPNTYNELVNIAITQEDCIAALGGPEEPLSSGNPEPLGAQGPGVVDNGEPERG